MKTTHTGKKELKKEKEQIREPAQSALLFALEDPFYWMNTFL